MVPALAPLVGSVLVYVPELSMPFTASARTAAASTAWPGWSAAMAALACGASARPSRRSVDGHCRLDRVTRGAVRTPGGAMLDDLTALMRTLRARPWTTVVAAGADLPAATRPSHRGWADRLAPTAP